MGWFRSLFSPFKRLWNRLHSRHTRGRGIYILYKDVKSCPCEDVQVLWSILVHSQTAALPSKRSEASISPELVQELQLGLNLLILGSSTSGYHLYKENHEDAPHEKQPPLPSAF
ncbi:hypothetical protein Gogos_019118 [Gossypium gossypioides]|uniref:Uncharacterized protein n=3 Tax=Gossypium TaxID=3633 RepID=A0A7J9BGH0_GOSGO|nr:hypothetical protein [Gossypium gossypioides]